MSHFECCLKKHFQHSKRVEPVVQIGGRGRGGMIWTKSKRTAIFFVKPSLMIKTIGNANSMSLTCVSDTRTTFWLVCMMVIRIQGTWGWPTQSTVSGKGSFIQTRWTKYHQHLMLFLPIVFVDWTELPILKDTPFSFHENLIGPNHASWI